MLWRPTSDERDQRVKFVHVTLRKTILNDIIHVFRVFGTAFLSDVVVVVVGDVVVVVVVMTTEQIASRTKRSISWLTSVKENEAAFFRIHLISTEIHVTIRSSTST